MTPRNSVAFLQAAQRFLPTAVMLATLSSPGESFAQPIPLNESRHTFTLTKLDDGRVLAVGGEPARNTCEIFDPKTNEWSFVAPLSSARSAHVAVKTLDGRVVIIGGSKDGQRTASVEIYSPTTDTWQQGPNLSHIRIFHTASLLPSGRILVAGGTIENQNTTDIAEIIDLSTMTVSAAPKLKVPRSDHTAITLGNAVILLGGHRSTSSVTQRVERFVEGASDWEELESMLQARVYFEALALNSETMLVFGGVSSNQVDLSVQKAELYTQGHWQYAGLMPVPINLNKSGTFADGRVLSIGGSVTGTAAIASVVFAWSQAEQTWEQLPSLHYNRAYHAAVNLDDNRVIVAGGVGEAGATSEIIELAQNGAACIAGLQCESTWCIDAVCCQSECAGPCHTCRVADNGIADGTCSYALKDLNPRLLCTSESSECGALGTCDGAGQCAKVQPTTPCSGFDRCEDKQLHTGQCDGLGNCRDKVVDCLGYACDNTTVLCLNVCKDDTECLNTHYCNQQNHLCVEKPPVRCLEDEVTLIKADDTSESCLPFRCVDGTCLKTCEHIGHCANGFECTANGRCEPAQTPGSVNFLCSTSEGARSKQDYLVCAFTMACAVVLTSRKQNRAWTMRSAQKIRKQKTG